jgi:hypothetical protein
VKSLVGVFSRKFFSRKNIKKQMRPHGGRLGAESLETRAMLSATALTPDLVTASDTGWSAVDNRTGDTTPTFVIQASDADAVKLFQVVGKRVTQVGTATKDGAVWTATLGPLGPGRYSIAAQGFDAQGVAGKRSKPLVVEIGTAAPAVPTIGLDPKSDSGFKGDRITNVTNPVLVGRAKAGTVVLLTSPSVAGGIEQRVAVSNRGVWAYRTTALADGNHDFTVKSQNVFGLESTTATLSLKVDTVRPRVVDMRYISDVNEIELEFSAPVRGVDVGDFRLSAPDFRLQNVPLTDKRILGAVGRITVKDIVDGRVYRLQMSNPDVIGGTFAIQLIAVKSGIVAATSGNPLLLDRTVSATF